MSKVKRPLMKMTRVRLILMILAVVAAGFAIQGMGFSLDDWNPQKVRQQVLNYGWWGPFIFLIIFGQPLIPLPVSVFGLAAGLIFGPWFGFTLAALGSLTRAAGGYGVGRFMGNEKVERLLHRHVNTVHTSLKSNGFKTVLLVRLVPNLPFDFQNYILGSTGVAFVPYVMATILGTLPWMVCFVLVGNSVMEMDDMKNVLIVLIGMGSIILLNLLLKVFLKKKKPELVDGE